MLSNWRCIHMLAQIRRTGIRACSDLSSPHGRRLCDWHNGNAVQPLQHKLVLKSCVELVTQDILSQAMSVLSKWCAGNVHWDGKIIVENYSQFVFLKPVS